MTKEKFGSLMAMIKQRVPHISEDDLAKIESHLEYHALPSRHFIIRAGEKANDLNYLLSGLVRAFYVDESGDEITVNFIEEGQMFADFYSITNSLPSRYWFQSLEPVEYLSLPIDYIEMLCRCSHDVEHFYRLALTEVHNDWIRRTEDFLFLNAEDRYRRFLSDRAGIAGRVSVKDLASYLGVRRQSLTRIRKSLIEGKK